MDDEKTSIELDAAELASELDRAISDFLAGLDGDGDGDGARSILQSLLWDNKVGLLRIAQHFGLMAADLRETLRAVLYNFGPDGTKLVLDHVMSARKARDSNDEIDRIERLINCSVPSTPA